MSSGIFVPALPERSLILNFSSNGVSLPSLSTETNLTVAFWIPGAYWIGVLPNLSVGSKLSGTLYPLDGSAGSTGVNSTPLYVGTYPST